jgi:glycosyltransferase involved in cell wall biosynthesis
VSKPLISVIIPVYNVESYLCKCLDSVLNQTYKNLEIILVDDGSKDKSGEICDEYALGDKRIVVIHQENAGLGMARNAGLNICKGEYLTFVDSDDYIDTEMIQDLFENLCRYDADFASCYSKTVNLLVNIYIKDFEFNQQVIYEDREQLLLDLYRFRIPHEAWGKLFKRKLFVEARFDKYKMSEDILIWLNLYSQVQRAIFLHTRQYYYVVRAESLMSFEKFNTNVFDDVIVMRQLKSDLSQLGKKLSQVGEMRYFNSTVSVLQKFARFGLTERYVTASSGYQEEIRKNLTKLLFNPIIEVKKKISFLLVSIDLQLFYKTYCFYMKLKDIIINFG